MCEKPDKNLKNLFMAANITSIWESSFALNFFSDTVETVIDLIVYWNIEKKKHSSRKANYDNKSKTCIIPFKKLVTSLPLS